MLFMKAHSKSRKKISKSKLIDRIPNVGWLTISIIVALIFWTILSIIPSTSRSFPNVLKVIESVQTMIDRGVFFEDILSSLISVTFVFAICLFISLLFVILFSLFSFLSVISVFVIGFIISLPVAILMAWYRPIRYVVEPWIQFVRNIPPLAYVPLVVISAGVGRTPQIIVITIATFLIMTITIYEGVKNIDPTLVKAARVLGARVKDVLVKIIAIASLPSIITAIG